MAVIVNSVSGGKTSSYIAANYKADYNVFSVVCIDDYRCAPKDKKLVQYINDKLGSWYIENFGEFIATAEDDKTLYVMRDLEQYIGSEITWVRGVSYDQLLTNKTLVSGNPSLLPTWKRRYCTTEMKILPIFEWWMQNVGVKVKMNIGFRFDEYDRMERFFNGSNPTIFRYPVSCSTKGQRRQKWHDFNWRSCHFPLIKDVIDKDIVNDYWMRKGLDFPVISNCVGCFHKKGDTLAIMCNTHPEKMRWFANCEALGMGTWLDSGTTYDDIIKHAADSPYIVEMLREHGASCDSGGCTD